MGKTARNRPEEEYFNQASYSNPKKSKKGLDDRKVKRLLKDKWNDLTEY